MAGSSQSDVDTNSVNTYNSIQPSSPLMDNNISNINPTPASDTNANTGSTDSSLIENLAGTPPVTESNAPVEEFPQQEPSNTVPGATLTPDSSVETVDTSSNLAEQHIEELNELGANIQPGGVVEATIKELGGKVSEVTDEEGNIKIRKTVDGKLVKVTQDGTQYDKDGNIIPKTPEEDN